MITLTHSNEVGGTTIFDDGTKCYWSESGSTSIIIKPNGKRIEIQPFVEHPLQAQIDDVSSLRPMTQAEEAEFDLAMGYID